MNRMIQPHYRTGLYNILTEAYEVKRPGTQAGSFLDLAAQTGRGAPDAPEITGGCGDSPERVAEVNRINAEKAGKKAEQQRQYHEQSATWRRGIAGMYRRNGGAGEDLLQYWRFAENPAGICLRDYTGSFFTSGHEYVFPQYVMKKGRVKQ